MIEISSADKVLFPDEAITKEAVVRHYERVGDAMLAFVGGRPLTLQRFPRGIGAKGFMQKNVADHFPASIARVPVPKRGGGETVYPVVHRAGDLAWLANQNTITFHMWLSTAETPGQPDWMVIDLDPEAGDVAAARHATAVVRDILADHDLSGFPLATGSKGFHVWVPLVAGTPYNEVALASRAVAGLAVLAAPNELTVAFLKRARGRRVFVDWLRNGPTATVVAPFSLRPRAGAPVAVPLRWEELPDAEPDGWRIGDLGDRLDVSTAMAAQELDVARLASAARAEGVDLDTPHDRFGRR